MHLLKRGRGNAPLLWWTGEPIIAVQAELVWGCTELPLFSVTLTLRKGFPLRSARVRLVFSPKVIIWRRWGEKPEPCESGKKQQKKEKTYHILRVHSGALRTQPVRKWLHLKTSSMQFSHSSTRNMRFAKRKMESLSPDKIESKAKLWLCVPHASFSSAN